MVDAWEAPVVLGTPSIGGSFGHGLGRMDENSVSAEAARFSRRGRHLAKPQLFFHLVDGACHRNSLSIKKDCDVLAGC